MISNSNIIYAYKVFKQEVSQMFRPASMERNKLTEKHFFHLTRGPMTPGLEPREASNRLNIFQSQMDDLWRKYETYKDGEKLFGLPVTSYPELQKIMKDMTLLQKLYQLYNQVLDTIKGFGDIPWNEVDVEAIRSEMEEFQMRSQVLLLHPIAVITVIIVDILSWKTT